MVKKIRSKKIIRNKSVAGTLTMYLVSLIVTSSILFIYQPNNMLLGIIALPLIATLVELLSFKGIDNLTVPLITSLIALLLFL